MWFLYKWFFHAIWGATPGKLSLGIRVVNAKGERRLGIVRGFVRAIASELSTLTFLIGYIIAAFRPDKRALHDLIAGTFPIKWDPAPQQGFDPRDPWRTTR